MKRLVIACLITIIAIIIYLSFFGLQTVSTDKTEYAFGEQIKIHWSNTAIEWCTCSGKDINILYDMADGWNNVPYDINKLGEACVDGKISAVAMPCDFVICHFPALSSKSGDYIWDSKEFLKRGTVKSCLDSYTNEPVNKSMQNYEKVAATPGFYRVEFGSARASFMIKG